MGIAVYVCKICERYFLNPRGIILHKKEDHPEEYERYKKLRKEEIKRRKAAANLAYPDPIPNAEVSSSSSSAQSNEQVQEEGIQVDTTISNNEEPVASNRRESSDESPCGSKKLTRSTSIDSQKDKNHDNGDGADNESTHSSNINANEATSDDGGEIRSPNKPPFKCSYCEREFRTARTRESHQNHDHLYEKMQEINRKTATNRRLDEQRKKQAQEELLKKQERNKKRKALAREQASILSGQKIPKKEIQNTEEANNNNNNSEPKTTINSNIKKKPIKSSSLYNCQFCPIKFKEAYSLEIHERKHKRLRNRKQQVLRREERKAKEKAKEGISSTTNAANSNPENKKVTTNHQCVFCHKKFTSDTFLQQHMNVHLNLKPFTCDLCSETFSMHMQRKRHMDKFHSPNSTYKLIKCKFCSSGFVDPEALAKHESNHKNETSSSSSLLNKSPQKFRTPIKSLRKSSSSPSPTKIVNSSISNNRRAETKSNTTIHNNSSSQHLVLKKKMNGHIRYMCKVCKKDFRSQLSCLSHARHHVKDYPFKCTFEGCKKAYSDRYGLARHEKASHSKIIQQLKNKNKRLSSTKSSSSNKGYPCTKCNKEFSSFREKYNHERQCKQLGRHSSSNGPPAPSSSSSKVAKITPLQTYSKEISERNEKIAYGTQEELSLLNVIHDEEGTRYHQCTLCTNPIKKFKKRLIGVEHIRSNHSTTEEDKQPLVCPYKCGKRMRTLKALRNHEAVHSGNRRFKCEFCGKGFFNYNNNYQHQKICQFRKSNENLSSNEPNTLDEQEETQPTEVESPWSFTQAVGDDGKIKHLCIYCPKVFSDRNSAQAHVNKHRNEKPYVCDFTTVDGVCKKSFSDKNILRQHLHDHRNDGKFKCCFCTQISNRATNLREHISRRHPEMTAYECELCHLFFPSFEERGNHQVTDHETASTSNIQIEDLIPEPIRSSSPTPSSSSSSRGRKRGEENQQNECDQMESEDIPIEDSPNKRLKVSPLCSKTTTKPAVVQTKPIATIASNTITTTSTPAPTATPLPNATTTTTTTSTTTKPADTSKTNAESTTSQNKKLPVPCNECGQRFETYGKYYLHNKASHSSKVKTSSTSTTPTKNSATGSTSNGSVNSTKSHFSCSECSLIFTTLPSLKDHEKSCRNSINTSSSSSSSSVANTNASAPTIHLEIRRPHLPVSDNLVSGRSSTTSSVKSFSSSTSTSRKETTDKWNKFVVKLGKDVFKCKLCPKKFPTAQECTAHARTHM